MIKTMDSLLEKVEDSHLISRWIAIDDGSSTKDICAISKRYPFLEIFCNDDKGHPQALNNLFARVDTAYAFHFEDDWEFCTEGKLVTKCLDVLAHDPSVGVAGLRSFAHKRMVTANSTLYSPHIRSSSRNRWPGFSLNPGLIDMEKLRDTGPFLDEQSFEFHFARRFDAKGYKQAYVIPPNGRVWIKHLGIDSSYNLNNTQR